MLRYLLCYTPLASPAMSEARSSKLFELQGIRGAMASRVSSAESARVPCHCCLVGIPVSPPHCEAAASGQCADAGAEAPEVASALQQHGALLRCCPAVDKAGCQQILS